MQPARKTVAMLKKACPYQTGIAAALTRMTRPGDMTGFMRVVIGHGK
jgi:hypothetical protein